MNPFHGRHFQGGIILWAVRWYCKYGISYRELQEMLAERGVNVDHTTIYRWVQRYAPEIEKCLRWYWRHPTDLSSWHIDETYVKGMDDGLICILQLISVVIPSIFISPLDVIPNQHIVFLEKF